MNSFYCYIRLPRSGKWTDCRRRVWLVVYFIHCLWERYARAKNLGFLDFFIS